MGDYENRGKELAERFAKIRGGLPEADAARVDAALKTHATTRDTGLTELAAAAADTSESPRAEAFNAKLKQVAEATCAPLNALLEGITDKPANLVAFREIAVAEEARFFEALTKVKLGEARDAQLLKSQELLAKVGVLKTNWDNMSETEKALLEKERYYAGQMREAVKKAFEEAVPYYLTGLRDTAAYLGILEKAKKQIDAEVRKAIKKYLDEGGDLKKLAEYALDQSKPGAWIIKQIYELSDAALDNVITGGAGAVIKTMGKASKVLEPILQNVIDHSAIEIRDNLTRSYTVIVTFSTTRREAADYVATNNYDKAKEQYDAVRRSLEEFQNSQREALNLDAVKLVRAADGPIAAFLEKMRKAHAEFVDKNKGIFVESVSTQTINALTDKPYFEEWYDGIAKMDFDQKLKELYGQINDLNGDLDRAFGSMDVFTTLPLEAQSIIQKKIQGIQGNVHKPFTDEMRAELKKMEDARTKKPEETAKVILKTAKDLAEKALRAA